ncbi:RdgB/HAM1 family non-canonical purine NTP pyrophosphatase [Haliangium sp.]|uniref:RdgB/HAM1 family non-canonical purine NTP pyrophosphatase n=1 Tax=Haliangium sp. TaxID=2663208 RepID=UPI003D14DA3F
MSANERAAANRPRLVFATRNRGKVVELRQLLAELALDVLSLDDVACERPDGPEIPEVDEDGDTFAANAAKKALAISRATGLPALADDSGLEVDALDGQPGVHSARYAGDDGDDQANNDKLLSALADVPPERRGARFRSCLALADVRGRLGDQVLTAEGACEGRITEVPRGDGGFGYDPLFYLPELDATFAELGVGSKNDRSHRARAMRAMRPRLIAYFRLAGSGVSG